jgi:hypothetical protein
MRKMATFGYDEVNRQRVQVPSYAEFTASKARFNPAPNAVQFGDVLRVWTYHVVISAPDWASGTECNYSLSMPAEYTAGWDASQTPTDRFMCFASWRGIPDSSDIYPAEIVHIAPTRESINVILKNTSSTTYQNGSIDLMVVEYLDR